MEHLILKFDGYQIAERMLEGVMFAYKVEYNPEDILARGLVVGENITFTQQALHESDKKFLKRHRMNEADILNDMHSYISRSNFEYAIESFWEMLDSPEIIGSQTQNAREKFLDEAMNKLYS